MTAADLIAWRARLNLTQAEAAKALGCGRRTLQYYEIGRYPIPKYIALAATTVTRDAKAESA
jgi:DNA-binding XRE family transcriptional regulator